MIKKGDSAAAEEKSKRVWRNRGGEVEERVTQNCSLDSLEKRGVHSAVRDLGVRQFSISKKYRHSQIKNCFKIQMCTQEK